MNDWYWCTHGDDFRFIDRIICSPVNETGADDSINESKIITSCISLSIIHTGADDSINQWLIWNHLQVCIIINHSHRSRWFYQRIWNDHQVYININHSRWFYKWIWNHHQVYIIINQSHKSRRLIDRIICSCVNETLADDSINEYEIITRCVSLSIIHTGAFDFIN